MSPNPDKGNGAISIVSTPYFLDKEAAGEKHHQQASRHPSYKDAVVPKPSLSKANVFNLVIFGLAQLLGGMTFSLLAPFYTKEATLKGLSVLQTGLVYGSVFLTTIVFSPLFGKYIDKIGVRSLFLCGTFLAGASNVIFGFLQWVDGSAAFLWLSLSIRFVSAVGESAFFCSIYPLATKDSPEEYRSTILSIMETMFGIGMMVGPFLGGLLYEVGGFYFPFVTCGGSLVACTFVSAIFMYIKSSSEDIDDDDDDSLDSSQMEKTTYLQLLKMPAVSFCCIFLIMAEISVTWYLPSLQPFLEETFQMNPVKTGAMFMVEGATYAVFSPIWGTLLDRTKNKHCLFLFLGCLWVLVGFSLLGPAPFLSFIPKNIYIVSIGLVVQGAGVAATFITTLVYMMSASVANGAADSDQTRGMITSLWFLSENVAGYLGSAIGGATYDSMGFENSTVIVVGMQMLTLVAIAVLYKITRNAAKKENQKLLYDSTVNNNYKTIKNAASA